MSKRAIRRHHRDRLIQKFFKHHSIHHYRCDYYEPKPHQYLIYDLNNENDFIDFLSLDIDAINDKYMHGYYRSRKTYVMIVQGDGKQCLNPDEPIVDCVSGHVSYPKMPYFDWDEVYEDLREIATRKVTYRGCGCSMCQNPRKDKADTRKEFLQYTKAKEEFEEYGIYLPRKGKKNFQF